MAKSTPREIRQLDLSTENKHALLMEWYRRRQTEPFWSETLNKDSRRVWEAANPNLETAELRIVDDLARDGIALSSLEELFPGQGALARIQAFAASQREAYDNAPTESGFEKAAFIRFLFGGGGTKPEIDLSEPGIAEFLSDPVLNIGGAHLGSAAKFVRFSLQSNFRQAPDAERKASQCWHRDPDDRRIFKMFIYVNGVKEPSDGPFQYVRGSHDRGTRKSLFPQTPPFGFYPGDEEVGNAVSEDEIITVTGKAGTVIFADTNAIHRGGFSTRNERTMFAAVYVSKASTFGRRYVVADNVDRSELPRLKRFAVS
ncbi:hypothetical protein HFP51_08840 [Parasphingopyxis sp. CP4]|uniref:hypothetical protein n=1 Tax=Parasphingopyxis sp. CP4 TaxID=2724527 RepID=UPI0015A05E7A|nr:hypothetical protein [Parasphingopyxis sp. CP4]QLC22271.1 hypothetical protein HFP51_08840 [Parasphingopyxis sp. CP4]